MITLSKVFNRFPKLTDQQRATLAMRRIERGLRFAPVEASIRIDFWCAIGYLQARTHVHASSSKAYRISGTFDKYPSQQEES